MRYITSFLLIFVASTFLQTAVAQATHGPYIKGRTAYRMRLSRCAMWWRRLGDYTKSNGKWLTKNTPLYMELAKLSEREFHRWLADPRGHHPRVNCKVGAFENKREVMVLWYYIQTKAFNPPQKPVIVRQTLRRSKIRLIKTQKLMRERLETLRRVRKFLPDYKTPVSQPVKITKSGNRK